MNSELFQHLNNQKQHSVYAYVLIDSIVYNDERYDDKKYTVWCSLFNKPFGKELSIEKNNNEVIWSSGYGYPFSENEIEITLTRHKPKPKKVYQKVDITIIPESEKNKDVRSIRSWIINHTYELITIKKKKYKIVVEKNHNTVDYFLYDPKEYDSFIESLSSPLFEICKQWNDEEYIRLLIQLHEWKRKDENSESKKLIKYLSEIKGKFDIWYLENKQENPNLVEMILQIRKQIVNDASTILSLKSDLVKLNSEKEYFEKHFDKDIEDFPLDLTEKLINNETAIKENQHKIEKLRKKLYGTFDGTIEGLIWKHDRLISKYKKINLGDEKFEELLEKSTNRNLNKLEDSITEALHKNNIEVNEIELNDLSLAVLHIRLSNEDQFFEEIVHPEKIEQNLSIAINEVLKNKFNIDSSTEVIEKIKFTTPRFNRDERLIELNEIMWKLENEKRTNKDFPIYIAQVDKWLEEHKKEYKKLASHLVGDVLLGNRIKDIIRNEIDILKNDTGLTSLPEISFEQTRTKLIDDYSFIVYNIITNNGLDEKFSDDYEQLNSIIITEVKKLIPKIITKIEEIISNSVPSLPVNSQSLLPDLTEDNNLSVAGLLKINQELREQLKKEQNKYGKHDKDTLRKAYELQKEASDMNYKLTDENAIIEANKIIKYYSEYDLEDKAGLRTKLLYEITKSYSNYWKKKFREEEI